MGPQSAIEKADVVDVGSGVLAGFPGTCKTREQEKRQRKVRVCVPLRRAISETKIGLFALAFFLGLPVGAEAVTGYECTLVTERRTGDTRTIFVGLTDDPDRAIISEIVVLARYKKPISARIDRNSQKSFRIRWQVENLRAEFEKRGYPDSYPDALQYRMTVWRGSLRARVRIWAPGYRGAPTYRGQCKDVTGKKLPRKRF